VPLGLRLDADGDLDLTGGRLTLEDDVAQRVQRRLRLIRGEWFLDLDAGVPWLTDILGRGVNIGLIRSVLRDAILGTEGVSALRDFVLDFDRDDRRLRVSFRALGPDGAATAASVEVGIGL
jgi:hypothetical protein